MTALLVRDAVPDDAPALAPRLRAADLQEIRAVTRSSPEDVLRRGIATSTPCHAVVKSDGERPIAVFGVVPDEAAGSGAVWMLGSDDIVARPLLFLRAAAAWIARLQARYPVLRAVIDARNEIHVAWLRRSGFALRRTLESHGVEQRRFLEFVRTQEV